MKTPKLRFTALLALLVLVWGCSEDDGGPAPDFNGGLSSDIFPSTFTVDIPDALSFDGNAPASGRISHDEEFDGGADIYEALRIFIWVGEASAEILEGTITEIVAHDFDNLVAFSLISDDDGRQKDFEIKQQVTYGGQSFEFELTMFDEDGAQGAQLIWSRDPARVVAILRPYDIDRTEGMGSKDVFYQIEYAENQGDYEASMVVSITNIQEEDKDFLDNMKMFVGKNGDVIDVYGNSNHPELTILDPDFQGGRNYAFVARGDEVQDIAVAIVGLPPSSVSMLEGLLEEYSVYNVFEQEMIAVGITNPDIIEFILQNAHSPAYFIGEDGFVGSGDNVPEHPGFTADFRDLSGLSPFVPKEIKELELEFWME